VKCNVSPFGRNYGKPQPSGLINNTYVTTLWNVLDNVTSI
jgi:hypothetical protein